MSWDAFHARARAALPDEELPPKRFWIGVLGHDKLSKSTFEYDDFLWLKAHGKITVDAIRNQYEAKCEGIDVELVYQNQRAQGSTMMRDVNAYNDNTIFFKAIEKSAEKAAATAPPALSGSDAKSSQKSRGDLNPLDTTRTTASLPGNNVRFPLTPISANIDNLNSSRTEQKPKSSALTPSPGQVRDSTTSQPAISNRASLTHIQTPMAEPSTPVMAPRLSHPPPPSYPATDRKIAQPSTPIRDEPDIPFEGNHEEGTHANMKAEQAGAEPDTQLDTQQTFDSFDADEVFEREMSDEPEDDVYTRPSDTFLRKLIDQNSAEVLEAAVARALKILNHLSSTFSPHVTSSPDAASWVQSIEKLKKMAERKRTVVGVVGNTGAGKSSVINALLDEERLVPTNCMRACTAVVTEMSWNNSDELSSKYRAEIEFVNPDEWRKELTALLSEFRNEDGNIVKETTDPNTEAGIAWAKFQAVYPKKTKDVFKDTTADELMAEQSVLNILGTIKTINAEMPENFYRRLQTYVDSKEKNTGREKEKGKRKSMEMEYWPLIKVVRIYTKSPALSTGAVIVDLPGVHDSNAARSAVAQNYLKQCTGLWIVAPITRAVDDKSAKTLLGDTFKRQLKYDGGLSAVTFICSKTDDISITEATTSLDIGEQMFDLEDQEKAYEDEIKAKQRKIKDLEESRAVYFEAMQTVDAEIEIWEGLQDKHEDGKTVYAPVPESKDRKAKSQKKKSRNKDADDSDDDFIVADSDTEEEEEEEEEVSDTEGIEEPRTPLTLAEIKEKIKELKETKKNARRTRLELELPLKDLKAAITTVKNKMKEVRSEISAVCIDGRNKYSRGAIQQDFAQGIKELDQETAAEEDEENFNPDEDLRDYDQVAASLPVFCVSSRAYQKLCGRLKKDSPVPGFRSKEETEIPQLQAHCKKLTEAGRIRSCRAMLLSFAQHLNTFFMWAASDGSGLKLTDDEKRREAHYIEKRLGELEKGMESAVESCIKAALEVMTDQIFSKYPEAIEESIQSAPAAVGRWHAPTSAGGLFWSTYKAIVRRDGTYTSPSRGACDFNAELSEPISKRLATGWERAFQHRLPRVLQSYTKNLGQLLHKFHEVVEERARQNGAGFAHIQLLANQIDTYQQLFGELQMTLVTDMNELQRNANREFTPTIVSIMHTVYEACASESGTGCFKRMKSHMANHVDTARHEMFTAATSTVTTHLKQMCRALEEKMANMADEIYMSMKRDYMSVLGGATLSDDARKLTKEERQMRAAVKAILFEIDPQFERLANGEIVEDVAEDVDMPDADEGKKGENPTEEKNDENLDDHASDFEPLRPATQEDDVTGPSSVKVEQSGPVKVEAGADAPAQAPSTSPPSRKRTRTPSVSRSTPPKRTKLEDRLRSLSVTPKREEKHLPITNSEDASMKSPSPFRSKFANPVATAGSVDENDDEKL